MVLCPERRSDWRKDFSWKQSPVPPQGFSQRSPPPPPIPQSEEGVVCAGIQRRALHFSLGKGQVREDFLEEGAMVPDKPMILDISWGLRGPGDSPTTTQCKSYPHPACTPVHTFAHTHTCTHSAWAFLQQWRGGKG